MHLEAGIERVWRYTGRPYVRAHTPVFGLISIRVVIIGIWLQTWMRVIVDVDVCIRLSPEMWHLWRANYIEWPLPGPSHVPPWQRNRARLDKYLETVDGWHAGCWDANHQFVNLHPCECDKVTFPLRYHGELADGSWSCRDACWKLKQHSGVNSCSWKWGDVKWYCADTVLSVCYTQCQLMIMAWRWGEGWLDFVFCDDDWVVDEKERWRWRWERWGGSERIWDMRGTICLFELARPCIGVLHAESGLVPAA